MNSVVHYDIPGLFPTITIVHESLGTTTNGNMTESVTLSGRYTFTLPVLPDDEYTYVIKDPVSGNNIADGQFSIFGGDIVVEDQPWSAIIETIKSLGGVMTIPFIAVQKPVVMDGGVLEYVQGNVVPLTIGLPSGWVTTGKYYFLCVKQEIGDANADALLNRVCSNVDTSTVSITPTATELNTVGEFVAELTQYDDALGTTNPQTVMQFTVNVVPKVRD